MKTNTKTILLLLVSLLFLQGSCKKETDRCPTYELPPATQTGANTIGCLVDGVVLIPKRTEWTWNQPTILSFKYNEETGELAFRIKFTASEKAHSCGYPETSLRFGAYEVFNETNIEPDKFWGSVDVVKKLYYKTAYFHYSNNFENLSAELIITKLDTTNNIISGTFFFEGYEHSGTLDDIDYESKIFVTEGRFDFTYNQDGSLEEGYSN